MKLVSTSDDRLVSAALPPHGAVRLGLTGEYFN